MASRLHETECISTWKCEDMANGKNVGLAMELYQRMQLVGTAGARLGRGL